MSLLRSLVSLSCVTLCALLPCIAQTATFSSWDAYMDAHSFDCPGPLDEISPPVMLTVAGKQYEHSGARMVVKDTDNDHEIRIGVISAIKDVSAETLANWRAAREWFKEQNIEWLVVAGDVAVGEFDLDELMGVLAEAPWPILLVPGNSESKTGFGRAYRRLSAAHPNLINGMWVRQIVADDVEFWTLPGYFNKTFMHQASGCLYKPEDVHLMTNQFTRAGDRPVLLVSHGPPLGQGSKTLDVIAEGKNVGDVRITHLIEDQRIEFGVFSHILESGGRAVSSDMASPVAPDQWQSNLYLNSGALSGDPWSLNSGRTSYGMATLMTIKEGKAKYQLKWFARRPLASR